ncbi:DNA primase [Streptomyces sp. BPPL-273]|uniref:DNA primase n=1 Tax=Streptomyces TaxID=1883 RepID=UPI0021095D36|nr:MULTISPECIES: DNA primase [Streptomyces]MCQ4193291.1 DNA primase [Streptomyces parvulus]WHM29657.1 DNA primase [Streptomyces sp. BPPL-273]WML83455.1 DNA primase [Streptomyces sp. VNUA74]
MNRVGLGLAVGAGYLLGRTKKLKLAVAVGTMVAGKKMNLTPKGIAELVSTQLQNNPQFKEIGDQLRTDLRGVGKAASGAMVERQIDALANRLHGRTAEVRDQLSGVTSQVPGVGSDDSEASEDSEEYDERDDDERAERDDDRDERDDDRREAEAPRKTARKAPAKKAPAKKAPAKKTAAKRAQPAKKAAAKKASGARGAARGAARQTKGGGER